MSPQDEKLLFLQSRFAETRQNDKILVESREIISQCKKAARHKSGEPLRNFFPGLLSYFFCWQLPPLAEVSTPAAALMVSFQQAPVESKY
jgi:hypothetical protein